MFSYIDNKIPKDKSGKQEEDSLEGEGGEEMKPAQSGSF